MRIFLILMALLVIIAACGKSEAPPAQPGPTPGPAVQPMPEPGELDAGLNTVDTVDQDLNFSDLDTLSADLDFG
jgi:hypothetical protein